MWPASKATDASVRKPSRKTRRLESWVLDRPLETDDFSRAASRSTKRGRVEVDRSSRLRLVTMAPATRGSISSAETIRATIGRLGEFVVDTSSAVAWDLDVSTRCTWTIPAAGLLRTTIGWVGFKLSGHRVLIPAGRVWQRARKLVRARRDLKRPRLRFVMRCRDLILREHAAERSALLGSSL